MADSDKPSIKNSSPSDYQKPTTLNQAWENPRYHGKIIVAAGGEVHGTYKEERAVQLLKKLEKKYPDETPKTTIIPKGGMMMLPHFID